MEQDIDILLAKALDGALTDAEQQVLQEWIHASPANKEEYARIQAVWNDLDQTLIGGHFDTHAAWEKVANATGIQDSPAKAPISLFPNWLKMGIAAAVLVVGLFLFRIFDRGEEMVELLALNHNESLILPDQSSITLRKGASLRYPKEFSGNQRRVSLVGEAFFEITPDANRPFIVEAGTAKVQVLGTSFNVLSHEDEALVTVQTGKVQLSEARGDGNNSIVLTPGMQGRLKKGIISKDKISSDSYLYWKTGKLSFRAEPFRNVIKELGEIGHTTIKFDPAMPAAHQAQLVDISFKDQSLEEMLTDLCLITHCEWSKGNDGYTVRAAD